MGIGFAGAFLGGLAALLSPCAAMLLPSFFALAFAGQKRLLIVRTAAFYGGLLLTLVPLGVGAGALGTALASHRHVLVVGGGVMLIVLGAITTLGVQLPIPGLRTASGTGIVAVVLMGAVYGLGGACSGPILGAVLTMGAVSGSPLYGANLMVFFGAGMVVPQLLLALLWDRVGGARMLRPTPVRIGPLTTTVWALISGAALVGLGVLFLITDGTAALGGLLDARQQFQVENWLRGLSVGMPDLAVIVVVAVSVIVVLVSGERTRPDKRGTE